MFCVTNYWTGAKEREVDQMTNLLRIAEKNDAFFVYSSTSAADSHPKGLPDFETRWTCEQLLHTSKVPYLIVRPTQFAENFFGALPETHVASDRAFGWPGFDVHSHVKHACVALDDLGSFVAMAMQSPDDFIGKTLDLASFALTSADLLRIYKNVTGFSNVKPKGALPLWLLWFILPPVYNLFKFFNTQDFPADITACASYMPKQTSFADVVRANVSST